MNSSYNESGLLGLAFHPAYEQNGKFYVNYTTGNLRTRVSEFTVSADPNKADAGSERVLLEVSQPDVNHNGGQLAFGPDSLLYIALGDGGGANDQYGNGQNRSTLLGTILRIDVTPSSSSQQYTIPEDNPFAGNNQGWREEIWAWGLRNPWRFSFDRATGDLWAADVGQASWEEVNLIKKGGNYGWSIMEGFHCFQSSSCDTTGLEMPISEYGHSLGRSITGGYVYRGTRIPRLVGHYLYGDYVSRLIWSLLFVNGQVQSNEQIATSPGRISSFGEDEAGEIYILGHDTGHLYTLFDPTTGIATRPVDVPSPVHFELYSTFPNPFNPATTIRYSLHRRAAVELVIYDAGGRRLRTLVDSVQEAGFYDQQWDARTDFDRPVAGGLYFILLRSEGHQAVRKLIYVR